MLVRRDPRAVLRFAIEQHDWDLADLIAERFAPRPASIAALTERATATLIARLGLADPRK